MVLVMSRTQVPGNFDWPAVHCVASIFSWLWVSGRQFQSRSSG